MQATRTLFILGAGTSCEFGLPAGKALAQELAQLLAFDKNKGDDSIRMAIAAACPNKVNDAFAAIWSMSDGLILARSIDRYLDVHQTDEYKKLAGKIAIVKAILSAEYGSTLFSRENARLDFGLSTASLPSPRDSWAGLLFGLLQEGVHRENPQEMFRNISFINFNYDRCLEWFLLNSIQLFFGIGRTQAANILRSVEIIHPYGSVGVIPDLADGSISVKFGEARPSTAALIQISKMIRTFTEEMGSEDRLAQIRRKIYDHDRIVFMGFGFHRLNMDLLKPPMRSVVREVIATTFGQSQMDRKVTIDEVTRCLSAGSPDPFKIDIPDLTSKEFMRDYGSYLSLSSPK